MTESLRIGGIDISIRVFHLPGADKEGNRLFRQKLERRNLALYVKNLPRCLIVMEACGGSNHWERTFTEMGQEVKLISARFLKPSERPTRMRELSRRC